ncbi:MULTISPECIES: branched-chain amino acid ABC transporter ATP-binding protein/permease [Streptosporangium]|uniref:Branched-chain amino acid transport system permease protein n=1 Tax=Streptosporangium brasiliense TaxID=47480 RepID=A0ABT9QZ36_9ACTN|nr:ATP-binding cassette domain-containing protein [Streptosporangium brasiliense]MDP9862242.1 branched-chain amino acid transport system permease protein [Streptosporangium brasiliense]
MRMTVRLGLLAAVLVAAPFGLGTFAVATLTLGLCYGLFAYGLDLSWGRAGLLSVGHAAFFGLGAYAVALSQAHDLTIAVLLVAAPALSVAIALPMVRIGLASGIPDAPLILLTIGVSLLLQHAATSLTGLTGGTNGLSIRSPGVVTTYYLTLVVVAVVVAVTTVTVVRSRFGARLTAASRNPERAAQTGIDGLHVRSTAFVVSAAVSTVAGALYALAAGLVSPQIFGLGLSTSVLVWLALGGRGSTVGPFLGAVPVTVGEQMLGSTWQGWYVLGLAALFVLVVQFAPTGLAGIARHWTRGPAVRLPPAASVRRPRKGSGGQARGAAALVLKGIHKSFGPVNVLRGVDLTVEDGRCVCLIGPNGAGKSTLLAIVAGQLAPDGGEVRIFGAAASAVPIHDRVRLGVGRMFQIPSVLTDLSLADNIRLARMDAPEHVELPAEYDDLVRDGTSEARALPLADRRRLELAMVLAGAPRLMLLDEPAAGLGPDDARALVRELKEVSHRTGCAMLVVEHDMTIVRELADDVVVLHDGGVIAHGAMDEITADPAVREAYLGVH